MLLLIDIVVELLIEEQACWHAGRCCSGEFVTGHRMSSEKLPTYSCVSRLSASQMPHDQSRQPLAARNVPQMLPVRQLAQHGMYTVFQ